MVYKRIISEVPRYHLERYLAPKTEKKMNMDLKPEQNNWSVLLKSVSQIKNSETNSGTLCFLIGPGKRKILLVDLPPLIDIGVQVYFRRLD